MFSFVSIESLIILALKCFIIFFVIEYSVIFFSELSFFTIKISRSTSARFFFGESPTSTSIFKLLTPNFLDRKTPGLYDCKSFGLNLRMSEINSAIGKIQIKKIPKILKSRRENFKYLRSKLESLNENIQVIQNQNKFFISSNYCLIILFKEKKLYSNRQKIIKFLNKVGIGTSIYYPHPVSHMFFYKKNIILTKNCSLTLRK